MKPTLTLLTALLLVTPASRGQSNAPANLAFPEPVASWTEAVKQPQREAARKLVGDLKAAVARGALCCSGAG